MKIALQGIDRAGALGRPSHLIAWRQQKSEKPFATPSSTKTCGRNLSVRQKVSGACSTQDGEGECSSVRCEAEESNGTADVYIKAEIIVNLLASQYRLLKPCRGT